MATLTFSSTKSFFTKLTDIFQKREVATTVAPTMQTSYRSERFERLENELREEVREEVQPEPMKSKLNINLNDLKVISTALLHYRRSLSKQGDMEKAEGVERIDKQFFELIQALEARNVAA
jgi:hypothetical protein